MSFIPKKQTNKYTYILGQVCTKTYHLQVFTYYRHGHTYKKDSTFVYNVFVAFRTRRTKGYARTYCLDINTVCCAVYSIICVYLTRVWSSRKGAHYKVYLSPVIYMKDPHIHTETQVILYTRGLYYAVLVGGSQVYTTLCALRRWITPFLEVICVICVTKHQ